MICPNCKTENRPNAKFCDECGHELPTVAHLAKDMFDDSPTQELGGEKKANLQGIDLMNDSSYSPNSSGNIEERPTEKLPEKDAVTQKLDNGTSVADPDITQTIAPELIQAKSKSYVQNSVPKNGEKVNLKGNRPKTALIIILCVIAIGLAIAGLTYTMQLWGGKSVPDIVGRSAKEGIAELEKQGFIADVVQVKSDEVEDTVLSTKPPAGTRLDKGSQVVVEVSIARVVPNLLGMNLADAKEALNSEGFTNVIYTEKKSNDAENTVLSITPDPGTRAKADAKIEVTYAVPFRVPDVNGMSETDARAALEAEGYAVSIDYVYEESIAEGIACSTDPAAGTALASGSNVVLNLARHRSTQFIADTRAFLAPGSKIVINGVNYEVSEIQSVTYQSGNTCAYTIVARQYEIHTWFGFEVEIRYGNYETINGTITWTDGNTIQSSNPPLSK